MAAVMAASSSRARPRSTASNPAWRRRASSVAGSSRGSGPGRAGRAVDQLVAGRQHADARPAEHGHAPVAQAGQHAEVAGREHGAGSEHLLAGRDVLAGRTWSPTVAGCSMSTVAPVGRRRALDHDDGVGAGGHRGAGHDAHGLARPDLDVGRGAGGDGAGRPAASTGAPTVSAARTAKPSMAVLAKGGTSSSADTAARP